MKSSVNFDIKNKNSKFIILQNGEPVQFPKSDNINRVTEFETLEDAQKYVSILQILSKKKNDFSTSKRH